MTLDNLPLSTLVPIAVILWTLLILVTLVSLRRSKVKRDKYRRLLRRAARRETHIQLAEESDPFTKERYNL